MGSDGFESKNSEVNRPAGRLHREGSVLDFRRLVRTMPRLRRSRVLAMLRPISSRSAVSSNGSMHQRATVSSYPIMVGRMCCCMSRFSAATAIRPLTRGRASSANACSGRRAIRRSGSSRWTDRPRSTQQMLPPRTHVSVTPTSGLERAQVKWFNRLRGFRFPDLRGGYPRYLCPHGNPAALRRGDDRAAARTICLGPVLDPAPRA